MKKYIGTKQIEAEPMTMGEAYEKGLLQAGRVPNDSEMSNVGYHVRYQDGYESWLSRLKKRTSAQTHLLTAYISNIPT